MFLDLFNDLSHAALSTKLQAATDLYKSTSTLNLSAVPSTGGTFRSSVSDQSSLSRHCDSGIVSPMSTSLYSATSALDLSPPSPTKSAMTQSMCDLHSRGEDESHIGVNYHGSQAFQEKVGDLKDRLATLLESNYNSVVVPPDTTSSYIRNLRLRKQKPLGGGRVFTVFSRATRKNPKFYSADSVIPMQLGRRD